MLKFLMVLSLFIGGRTFSQVTYKVSSEKKANGILNLCVTFHIPEGWRIGSSTQPYMCVTCGLPTIAPTTFNLMTDKGGDSIQAAFVNHPIEEGNLKSDSTLLERGIKVESSYYYTDNVKFYISVENTPGYIKKTTLQMIYEACKNGKCDPIFGVDIPLKDFTKTK